MADTFIISDAKILFKPYLNTPSTYGDNPKYEVCVKLTKEDATKIKALKTSTSIKTDDNGEKWISLKSRKKPRVIHPNKRNLTDDELDKLGIGSTLRLRAVLYSGSGQYANKTYIGLGPICVTEYIEYTGDAVDDLVEGFEDFTDASADKALAEVDSSKDDDDDLPF